MAVARKIQMCIEAVENDLQLFYHFSREDPHLKEWNGRSPASRWGMNRSCLIFFDFELKCFPLLL